MKRARSPLFGDDVFLSYKREEDAEGYAVSLANELTKLKLACFIDQHGTPPGRDVLPEGLRRRIRRCALFVLVGSAGAARSQFIQTEVDEALAAQRIIIPITFKDPQGTGKGTLQEAVWFPRVDGLALSTEPMEALKSGRPSGKVIDRIVNAEGFKSRAQRLRRMFWSTVFGTAAVLVVGGLAASALLYNTWIEVEQVKQEQRYAELERDRAGNARDWALAEQAMAEQQTREEQIKAEQADSRRQKAETLADQAVSRQRIAERTRRRARAEVLALAARSLLEKEPQRSLTLAVEAVDTFRKAGDPWIPAAEQALRDALAYVSGVALRGHSGEVYAIALARDVSRLATSDSAGAVRLWDLRPGPSWGTSVALQPECPTQGTGKGIDRLAISPDGRWVMASNLYRTCLWDLGRSPAKLHLGDGNIEGLGFTPEGRWAVAIRVNCSILWDLQSLTAEPPVRHLLCVRSPTERQEMVLEAHQRGWIDWDSLEETFAASADYRWVLSSRKGAPAVLWDLTAANPWESRIELPASAFKVSSIAVSPDGRWLAGIPVGQVSERGDVYLWKLGVAAGAEGPLVLAGSEVRGQTLAFSPNSRWLIVSDFGQTRLWDLQSTRVQGTRLGSIDLRGQTGQFIAIPAFSPDGRWLATVSDEDLPPRLIGLAGSDWHEETVRLWDLEAEEPASSGITLKGLDREATNLSFSPDSRWLVATGGDTGITAYLWNLAPLGRQGEVERAIPLRGQEGPISGRIAFSPDSRWIIAGSADRFVHLWDLAAQGRAASPLRLPNQEIMAFSSDGRWLVSTDGDEALLRDLHAGTWPPPSFSLGRRGATQAEIALGNRWLVMSVDENVGPPTLLLWDLDRPADAPAGLPGGRLWVESLQIGGGDRWLIAGCTDGKILAWDLKKPHSGPVSLEGHDGPVQTMEVNSDGTLLVTAGGEDTSARLWRLRPEAPPILLTRFAARPLDNSAVPMAAPRFALSRSGRWLVSYGKESNPQIWDRGSQGSAQRELTRSGREVVGASISPDERWLVIAVMGKLLLWDLKTRGPDAEPTVFEKVYPSGRHPLAFSSDSRWLTTGELLWDLRSHDPGMTRIRLALQGTASTSTVFSPDKHRFVVQAGKDVLFHTIPLEELKQQALQVGARHLTCDEWADHLPGEPCPERLKHEPSQGSPREKVPP
jgi:WD40 repeat protein